MDLYTHLEFLKNISQKNLKFQGANVVLLLKTQNVVVNNNIK